ncbi:hypothetical protein EW145_g4663 [Phellinidium pouzarii]|uniref:DH domain-containing protein n=1 Tax=Phellinidium pouzarii TaxID=167371 RepID=A0A4S4L7J4_9AGAM|nr:hypothetical protein EW145_g4663 [Phellinidium pouzarii]
MFRSTASATPGSSSSHASTMAISTSPRKIVPLSSGDDWQNRKTIPTLTKRAFFCGVVVEGPSDGLDLSEDVQDLVASLGDRISSSDREFEEPSSVPLISSGESDRHTRTRVLTNTSALADLINELVTTERNYVQRLRILKDSYADPLRSYARSKDTAIIAAYEAKILFGNVDQLLPANEAFLHDLEQMGEPEGARTVGGVGDVALHHFKDLRAFECYKQYYVKREEAQSIFKREMAKKSSTGFAAFVERIKYSTNDPKNRVGLRELLMEPVQRIPRYTLLFRSMIKFMAPSDPQRARLAEADEIASRIALAETDDHTRLAATLNCLASSIDGFPPALISSSRRFIDCLDVEDNIAEAAGMNPFGSMSSGGTGSSSTSGGSGSNASLHCTLILFDDKLMLAKRSSSDKSGRTLAGLDAVERFANGAFTSGRGRGLTNMRRGGMSCKGVVDITEVVATDVSGTDIHLYLENPPLDQTERWMGRPFRVMTVVLPGSGNLDLMRTENEKRRFLENLWRVQARYRTKTGQSVALCADEKEVESRGGKVTIARTYFNVFQRTMFLKEPKKTKVVLHIDSLGNADPLPFGMDGPPYVVVRLQPLPGELCRYTVRSSDPDDEKEEDVVQTSSVPTRIVHTIHQYGLFKFRTNNPSRPATPSGGNRSRAHIFSLDVLLSRNLFGALPGTSKNKDPFSSGSIGSHRRSKSAISRASTIRTDTTDTSTIDESSTKFSSRSNSTAATSMSSFVADGESLGKRSSKSRKLVKRDRSRSPGETLGGRDEYESGQKKVQRFFISQKGNDVEEAELSALDMRNGRRVTQSEMDLTKRLELARRNSRNQHEQTVVQNTMDMPIEETIYEEDPPLPTRPSLKASRLTQATYDYDRDAHSLRSPSSHPRSRSVTPTPEAGSRGRRPVSHDRRPIGPRSPSPLPSTSPTISSMHLDIESTLADMSPERPAAPELRPTFGDEDEGQHSLPLLTTSSQLPRSKRQPFVAIQSTPKKDVVNTEVSKSTATAPLSVVKKGLTGPTHAIPTPSSTRKSYAKDSPLRKRAYLEDRHASPPPMLRRVESNSASSMSEKAPASDEPPPDLIYLAATTREDLESSQRALKRIKLEANTFTSRADQSSPSRSENPTPSHIPSQTLAQTNAAKREAQARLDEMRALIGRRNIATSRAVWQSAKEIHINSAHNSGSDDSSVDLTDIQNRTRTFDELLSNAESDLERAMSSHKLLEDNLGPFVSTLEERSIGLEKARSELRSAKRQCELVKSLLTDADAENEIMYDAFNEELDGMFNDANLPPEEAWSAMTIDLRKTKEERNKLTRENGDFKRRLREMETQRDEWATLLRQHGLIS